VASAEEIAWAAGLFEGEGSITWAAGLFEGEGSITWAAGLFEGEGSITWAALGDAGHAVIDLIGAWLSPRRTLQARAQGVLIPPAIHQEPFSWSGSHGA
jgi:hypothetical protein